MSAAPDNSLVYVVPPLVKTISSNLELTAKIPEVVAELARVTNEVYQEFLNNPASFAAVLESPSTIRRIQANPKQLIPMYFGTLLEQRVQRVVLNHPFLAPLLDYHEPQHTTRGLPDWQLRGFEYVKFDLTSPPGVRPHQEQRQVYGERAC